MKLKPITKVLVCLGADDPIINADRRRAFIGELSAVGIDWQMHLHGGVGHSFTKRDIDAWNFPGFAYDRTADTRSWRVMRDFLAETFEK